MKPEVVDTGIEVIGCVPWGTHFCQFYQSQEDLLRVLVPYFSAGLQNNEFCMWVTADPLTAAAARKALARAVPDLAERLSTGQIEILPHTSWYLAGGTFDLKRVLNGWIDKLNRARSAGYTGMRVTGNTAWLEKKDWNGFTEYEAAINGVIGEHRMIALCTYSLEKCGAAEVMDVIRNHEFALVRRDGKWELIENAVHKQAKQALLDSERKYRQLVESLQEGVWVIDRDARTTFANPRMAEMLGYTSEEMLGRDLLSFVDEQHLDMARERMERRRKGISERVEFEFRRKDGSPLHAFISAAPLTDDAGAFSGVIAGIVDITERKIMEDGLRRSEERYRGLYQSVAGGIVMQDGNGSIVEANSVAREILGLTMDEITGRTSFDPEWRAVREDGSPFPGEEHPGMIALRTGQSVRGVTMGVFNPARQEDRWILINAEPLRDPSDGRVQSVATTFVDITGRRQAELALRESEEKYRLLFQNMAEGFALYELLYDQEGRPCDWRILEVNDAYTEHTGLARERVTGRRAGELFPEAIPQYLTCFAGVVARQRPERFETYSPVGRHQRVTVFPAGAHRFACVVEDISKTVEAERRTSLLADTASELLRSDSPQLVVNSLCARVMDYLDCQAFFNFLADESAGRLRLNAFAGISEEQAHEIEWLDYGVAVCGCAARDHCRLVAENIRETPDPRTELVKSYGIQAYACHPLIAQDHLLGTLSFGTRTRISFTEEELSLMKAVADLVAIAMQRKKTKDELRETGSYLDNLLNYANAPIIVWDPDLRITKFNQAFQRLTGHSEAEALGQHLAMLFPDETREASLSHIARTAAGERWETIEIPIRRKDGLVRTVLWNSANIQSSDGRATVSTIAQGQDITERKQAELALRETRDYLDNLLNYANAPIIVWDPDLRITKFNRAFQRLTGRSEAEALGQQLAILFPERSSEESLSHIRRATTGERWESVEIPILRVDGVVRTVLWNSANIHAPGGQELLATIAQGQDITERKEAEEAVRKLNDTLRQRAAELEVANKELEAFAYSVSHDLRTPLRSIDGFSLALLEDYWDRIDDQGKDYLNRVREASQTMGQLIDDMLDLSRVTRAEMHWKKVDLSGMARRIAANLQEGDPKRSVELAIASDIQAYGDPALLRAVLENLLGNAWKFTGKRDRARIEFGAGREDGRRVFFVRDNGVGFDPNFADRMFEPFQRLHRKKDFPGTGIGLATVKRIVNRHGGLIWAENMVGGGATFHFTLNERSGRRQDGERSEEGNDTAD